MTAVRIHKPGTAGLLELPVGTLDNDYSRVSIEAVGFSLQEIEELRRKRSAAALPRVPGAYAVGRVVESQTPPKRRRILSFSAHSGAQRSGEYVMLPTVRECGSCDRCAAGEYASCENPRKAGIETDGYLRQVADVPTGLLVALPADLQPDRGVFLHPLGRALGLLQEYQIERGDFVLVFGATVEGLLFSQVARRRGVLPILIDTGSARLELARRLGIDYLLNPYACHAPDEVDWIVGEAGVAVAVLASGEQGAADSVPYLLSPGGTIVALHAGREVVVSLGDLLDHGQTLSSPADVYADWVEAAQYLAGESVSVDPLVSLTVPLASAVDTLELLRRAPDRYLQVIVTPNAR